LSINTAEVFCLKVMQARAPSFWCGCRQKNKLIWSADFSLHSVENNFWRLNDNSSFSG
jgi:hypothetical protein